MTLLRLSVTHRSEQFWRLLNPRKVLVSTDQYIKMPEYILGEKDIYNLKVRRSWPWKAHKDIEFSWNDLRKHVSSEHDNLSSEPIKNNILLTRKNHSCRYTFIVPQRLHRNMWKIFDFTLRNNIKRFNTISQLELTISGFRKRRSISCHKSWVLWMWVLNSKNVLW